MRFRFNVPILDFHGKPILRPEDQSPILIRDIITGALQSDDRTATKADVKNKVFNICINLFSAKGEKDEVEISSSDLAVINEHIEQYCNPLELGRVKEVLDNPLPEAKNPTKEESDESVI